MKRLQRNSEQDNIIDDSYIEYMIFALWSFDMVTFIQNKAVLAKEFHIQPSEIDKMTMWEYELFMKSLNSLIKEENDRNKKDMDKYDMNSYNKQSRDMMRKYSNPPKIPSMKF